MTTEALWCVVHPVNPADPYGAEIAVAVPDRPYAVAAAAMHGGKVEPWPGTAAEHAEMLQMLADVTPADESGGHAQ